MNPPEPTFQLVAFFTGATLYVIGTEELRDARKEGI